MINPLNFYIRNSLTHFIISSELLRVESPSADIQGHGGPKKIVRNKGDVLISQIFLSITIQRQILH